MFYNPTIKLEIFGQSHSDEIGVTISGLPTGFTLNLEEIQAFVNRRKAARTPHSTPRLEEDKVEFVKGLCDNKICGGITAVIKNTNVRPEDYQNTALVPRPSHADYVSYVKYGKIFTGGGSFSGRMTAPLCIAGAIAIQILSDRGIEVAAYVSEIGKIKGPGYKESFPSLNEIRGAQSFPIPALGPKCREEMEEEAARARAAGDSVGGVIECAVFSLPAGLGGPLFAGLEGKISAAVFAIPAVKGVEFGTGFDISKMSGSQANDPFIIENGQVRTATNHSGGINGGVSNAMPITLRAAFRPTPSIAKAQRSVDLSDNTETELIIRGRHDACIVPRAVPCVESAVALAILDTYLENERI